jgi:hypothetical protein
MPDHHHHQGPPTPPEGFHALNALRLRFWIGGKLRDEVWIDASDPEVGELTERVSAYHLRLSEMAEAAGVEWMTEVYDPAQPEERAYLRIGTDAAGMRQPQPWDGTIPGVNGHQQ